MSEIIKILIIIHFDVLFSAAKLIKIDFIRNESKIDSTTLEEKNMKTRCSKLKGKPHLSK